MCKGGREGERRKRGRGGESAEAGVPLIVGNAPASLARYVLERERKRGRERERQRAKGGKERRESERGGESAEGCVPLTAKPPT